MILQVINQFSGLLTAVSTILLVIATLLLYEATKKRPQISIYIEPKERSLNFIDLIIKNIGDAPAYDVSINVIDDLSIGRIGTLKNLKFLGKPKYLAPKQKIKSFLLSWSELKDKKDFCLEVTYYNSDLKTFNWLRKKKKEKFYIDISAWEQIHSLGEDPLLTISRSLKDLQRDIHTITRNPIHVINQNKKDWEEELRAQRKKDMKIVKRIEKRMNKAKSK